MRRTTAFLLFASLLLGARAASADAPLTVVMQPAGAKKTKARHLERAAKSIAKGAAEAGVLIADRDLGALSGGDAASCAVDPACLAAAGASLGAARVVGILVENPKGDDFVLTFVLVEVAGARELARATHPMDKDELPKAPGARLGEFLAAAPEAEAPPPVETPEVPAPPPADPGAGAPAPLPEPEPAPAPAPEPAPASPAGVPRVGDLHIGLHSGVVLPQISTELGTALGGKLEVGYRVWRNLAPVLAFGYSQPVADNAQPDPRLTGTDYTASTTQRELTVTVGAVWWFLPRGSLLNGYAGVGARVYLLETLTNGQSMGEPFLENRETSTRFGGVGTAGAELRVGPGAIALEAELGGSGLPHLITGDVSTTAVQLTLGYRLFI